MDTHITLEERLKRAKKARAEYEKSCINRNSLCPCGSGKRYKRCCGVRHAN